MPVNTALQNKPKKSVIRSTRIIGALVLLGIASAGGWAYLDAKQQMERISKDLGTWSQSEGSESGMHLHMHDTYYVVASPVWTVAAILGIGVGLTAVLSPGIFHLSRRDRPNTEQGADGNPH
jgi:hypothetical protein